VTFPRPACADWIRSSNNVTQQFLSFGARPDVVSLAGGLPAAELYPMQALQHATDAAFRRHGRSLLEYGPVEGLTELRELIAARAQAETGCAFRTDHVLLTEGAMQGLDLIGKVLIDNGSRVIVQSPTYLGALDAWRPRAPAYERLSWDMDAARLRGAQFVYTVPNYSNPTGALVPQEQRLALLEQVRAAGTWLVEDDPYQPLQLDGPAGPSILASAATRGGPAAYDGPVIYLGTVSKSLVPGLRVGWVIAEPALIQRLALAKQCTDLSSSVLTQAIAYELMASGFDLEHAPTLIAAYRERRDVLCRAAALHLARWFEWEVPAGGMFVWMRSRQQRIDTNALYRFAIDEKVAFVPSSVFDFSGDDRFAMRINFTRSPPDQLAEGVRRLARAVERYLQA
jgi:2-aminoadipate transaminase